MHKVLRKKGYTARSLTVSRLAQLVERKTLNLVVVGSSPTVGVCFVFDPSVQKTLHFWAVRPHGPQVQVCTMRSSCGAAGSAWVS